MKSPLLIAGLGTTMLLLSACATTSRGDVRAARDRVDDAYAYGDRQDQQDARHDMRRTLRDYRDDHQCGPGYGRPC